MYKILTKYVSHFFQASIMNPVDDDDLDDSDLGQEDSGDHSLVKN